MNPLYEKQKDLVLIRRTSDNKEFEEYPLIVQPQSALVTDPTNDVICFSLCALQVGFATSASYSSTSSFAWNALSASYANSASYTISSSNAISASYAYTASYALETSAALYAVSASYTVSASYAFSASYAESASYGTNFCAPRITASFVSASVAIQTNHLTASNVLIRGMMFGSASYALAAASASYAESASYEIIYETSSSYADFAKSASYAESASYEIIYETSSSYADFAKSASYAESASYEIIYETSSSYADFAKSASYAESASYEIIYETSSSYADFAKSASYAESASYGTNFYAPRVTASFVSASTAIQTDQLTASNAMVRGLMQGTASYALTSISASYASIAALASMSLAVRGLNVNNVAPMANSDIGWTVDVNTPAVYDAIATIGPAPSEGQTHALIRIPENNKIYGGGWYGTIYVFNDPDNDFTNITSCSFNPGSHISQMVYASGSIYVLNGSNVAPSTGSITRVNINNITSQSVIVGGLTGATLLAGLATDGNYLFTVINSQIRKYDLSGSLVQAVAAVSASATITSCHGGTISTDKQWAFFSTTNGAIFKVKCSDVTNYTASRRQQAIFPSGPFDASLTDDICYLNGYVYSAVESNGNMFKMNVDDMTYTAYPVSGNSYGVFTDDVHIYLLVGNEIWVYLNGDTDSGPIRFGIAGVANELAITDGGRFVYSNWTTLNLYSYFLPITQLGINKLPSYALDVAGTIQAGTVIAPYISASNYIETAALITGDVDLYGTLTLDGTNVIRSNTSNALRISSGSVRVATLSSSAALLGRAFNTRFSQSLSASATMSYTQSLGAIATNGEGMYKLTVAGTIGLYSGSTIATPPSFSFVHTDRLGTYLMPSTVPVTYMVTPAGYDQGYAFSGEYVFQAIAGTPVAYYYSSDHSAVSLTGCSASFFTALTLTQIMSGSVTGSL